MLTKEFEYLQYKDIYQAIQAEQGAPDYAVLVPSDEKIYNIDLNSRTITAPEFIGVSKDHRAETIYFKVPRYYDNMDLSQTTCVVQYINAKKERRIFAVPFVDITTFKSSDEMVFPWVIDRGAARTEGTVTFSIKFYLIGEGGVQKDGADENSPAYIYELNTLPTTTKVLTGMTVITSNISQWGIDGCDDATYLTDIGDKVLQSLQAIASGQKSLEINWLDV